MYDLFVKNLYAKTFLPWSAKMNAKILQQYHFSLYFLNFSKMKRSAREKVVLFKKYG